MRAKAGSPPVSPNALAVSQPLAAIGEDPGDGVAEGPMTVSVPPVFHSPRGASPIPTPHAKATAAAIATAIQTGRHPPNARAFVCWDATTPCVNGASSTEMWVSTSPGAAMPHGSTVAA